MSTVKSEGLTGVDNHYAVLAFTHHGKILELVVTTQDVRSQPLEIVKEYLSIQSRMSSLSTQKKLYL